MEPAYFLFYHCLLKCKNTTTLDMVHMKQVKVIVVSPLL